MIGYWLLVLISGGSYSTKLQYSDGTIETVTTPVEFDIGTIVTVVHKKDGSVIVTVAQ
jgi:hypothetical protein